MYSWSCPSVDILFQQLLLNFHIFAPNSLWGSLHNTSHFRVNENLCFLPYVGITSHDRSNDGRNMRRRLWWVFDESHLRDTNEIYVSTYCVRWSIGNIKSVTLGKKGNRCCEYNLSFASTKVCYSLLNQPVRPWIDYLVQDCSDSIAKALELLQPCTKPLKCSTRGHVIPWADIPITGLWENPIRDSTAKLWCLVVNLDKLLNEKSSCRWLWYIMLLM